MTDTERETLCARIDELCAENERLRSCLSDNANELLSESDALREVLNGTIPVETECGGIIFVNPNSEINQLRVENAKLREQVASLTDRSFRMADKTDCLNAENTKLREYAARAWQLFTEHGAAHASELPEVDAVRDGLRELGIGKEKKDGVEA